MVSKCSVLLTENTTKKSIASPHMVRTVVRDKETLAVCRIKKGEKRGRRWRV